MRSSKSYEERVLEAIERAHWLDNFPVLPDEESEADGSSGKITKLGWAKVDRSRVHWCSNAPGAGKRKT